MKKLILTFIIIHACFRSYSQQIAWENTIQYNFASSIAELAADANGNIYACGGYSTSYHGTGPQGIFVHKYDSTGGLLWFDTVEVRSSYPTALVCTGNALYLAGNSTGGDNKLLQFDSIRLTKPDSAYTSSYLVKYDLEGHVLWAKMFLNVSNVTCKVVDGEIYFLGRSFAGYLSSGPCSHNFLARYSASDGSYLWSKCLSVDAAKDMAVFDTNNIFVSVYDYSTASDYIKKYNATGLEVNSNYSSGILIDINSLGNCYSEQGSSIHKLDFNTNLMYDLYVSQHYLSTVYCHQADVYTTGSYADAGGTHFEGSALIKFSHDTLVYNFPVGAYLTTDVIKSGNNVYVAAYENTDNHDALLIKVSEEGATAVKETGNDPPAIALFPNPSGSMVTLLYNSAEKQDLQLKVTDNEGRQLYSETVKDHGGEYKKEIDLSGCSKGVYTIEIIQGTNRQVKKVVVN
ncbi:MAG: hypothetical protein JWO09_26 [Bacteroidetes bacterium]|nr:hypothetical protein [Bacteroidota bacterium]